MFFNQEAYAPESLDCKGLQTGRIQIQTGSSARKPVFKYSILKPFLDYDFSDVNANQIAQDFHRYIRQTRKFKKETTLFIEDILNKVFLLHRYNLKVAEVTSTYPFSTNFTQLLLHYVVLECNVLYRKDFFSRRYEHTVEKRILRVLLFIHNEYLEFSNSIPKKKIQEESARCVLNLLIKIKPEFDIQNKLLDNIVIKLLSRIGQLENVVALKKQCIPCPLDTYLSDPSVANTYKNIITSDYGTDDDLRLEEEEVQIIDKEQNGNNNRKNDSGSDILDTTIKLEIEDLVRTSQRLSNSLYQQPVTKVCVKVPTIYLDDDIEMDSWEEEVNTSYKSLRMLQKEEEKKTIRRERQNQIFSNHRPIKPEVKPDIKEEPCDLELLSENVASAFITSNNSNSVSTTTPTFNINKTLELNTKDLKIGCTSHLEEDILILSSDEDEPIGNIPKEKEDKLLMNEDDLILVEEEKNIVHHQGNNITGAIVDHQTEVEADSTNTLWKISNNDFGVRECSPESTSIKITSKPKETGETKQSANTSCDFNTNLNVLPPQTHRIATISDQEIVREPSQDKRILTSRNKVVKRTTPKNLKSGKDSVQFQTEKSGQKTNSSRTESDKLDLNTTQSASKKLHINKEVNDTFTVLGINSTVDLASKNFTIARDANKKNTISVNTSIIEDINNTTSSPQNTEISQNNKSTDNVINQEMDALTLNLKFNLDLCTNKNEGDIIQPSQVINELSLDSISLEASSNNKKEREVPSNDVNEKRFQIDFKENELTCNKQIKRVITENTNELFRENNTNEFVINSHDPSCEVKSHSTDLSTRIEKTEGIKEDICENNNDKVNISLEGIGSVLCQIDTRRVFDVNSTERECENDTEKLDSPSIDTTPDCAKFENLQIAPRTQSEINDIKLKIESEIVEKNIRGKQHDEIAPQDKKIDITNEEVEEEILDEAAVFKDGISEENKSDVSNIEEIEPTKGENCNSKDISNNQDTVIEPNHSITQLMCEEVVTQVLSKQFIDEHKSKPSKNLDQHDNLMNTDDKTAEVILVTNNAPKDIISSSKDKDEIQKTEQEIVEEPTTSLVTNDLLCDQKTNERINSDNKNLSSPGYDVEGENVLVSNNTEDCDHSIKDVSGANQQNNENKYDGESLGSNSNIHFNETSTKFKTEKDFIKDDELLVQKNCPDSPEKSAEEGDNENNYDEGSLNTNIPCNETSKELMTTENNLINNSKLLVDENYSDPMEKSVEKKDRVNNDDDEPNFNIPDNETSNKLITTETSLIKNCEKVSVGENCPVLPDKLVEKKVENNYDNRNLDSNFNIPYNELSKMSITTENDQIKHGELPVEKVKSTRSPDPPEKSVGKEYNENNYDNVRFDPNFNISYNETKKNLTSENDLVKNCELPDEQNCRDLPDICLKKNNKNNYQSEKLDTNFNIPYSETSKKMITTENDLAKNNELSVEQNSPDSPEISVEKKSNENSDKNGSVDPNFNVPHDETSKKLITAENELIKNTDSDEKLGNTELNIRLVEIHPNEAEGVAEFLLKERRLDSQSDEKDETPIKNAELAIQLVEETQLNEAKEVPELLLKEQRENPQSYKNNEKLVNTELEIQLADEIHLNDAEVVPKPLLKDQLEDLEIKLVEETHPNEAEEITEILLKEQRKDSQPHKKYKNPVNTELEIQLVEEIHLNEPKEVAEFLLKERCEDLPPDKKDKELVNTELEIQLVEEMHLNEAKEVTEFQLREGCEGLPSDNKDEKTVNTEIDIQLVEEIHINEVEIIVESGNETVEEVGEEHVDNQSMSRQTLHEQKPQGSIEPKTLDDSKKQTELLCNSNIYAPNASKREPQLQTETTADVTTCKEHKVNSSSEIVSATTIQDISLHAPYSLLKKLDVLKKIGTEIVVVGNTNPSASEKVIDSLERCEVPNESPLDMLASVATVARRDLLKMKRVKKGPTKGKRSKIQSKTKPITGENKDTFKACKSSNDSEGKGITEGDLVKINEEQKCKPHDFLINNTKIFPPVNNIYTQKIPENHLTSEDSNDSEGNLLIDEEVDTKLKETTEEVIKKEVIKKEENIPDLEATKSLIDDLTDDYDGDTLEEDIFYPYEPKVKGTVFISIPDNCQNFDILKQIEEMEPSRIEDYKNTTSFGTEIDVVTHTTNKIFRNGSEIPNTIHNMHFKSNEILERRTCRSFRTMAERKLYDKLKLSPYVGIERLNIQDKVRNTFECQKKRSKSFDIDMIRKPDRNLDDGEKIGQNNTTEKKSLSENKTFNNVMQPLKQIETDSNQNLHDTEERTQNNTENKFPNVDETFEVLQPCKQLAIESNRVDLDDIPLLQRAFNGRSSKQKKIIKRNREKVIGQRLRSTKRSGSGTNISSCNIKQQNKETSKNRGRVSKDIKQGKNAVKSKKSALRSRFGHHQQEMSNSKLKVHFEQASCKATVKIESNKKLNTNGKCILSPKSKEDVKKNVTESLLTDINHVQNEYQTNEENIIKDLNEKYRKTPKLRSKSMSKSSSNQINQNSLDVTHKLSSMNTTTNDEKKPPISPPISPPITSTKIEILSRCKNTVSPTTEKLKKKLEKDFTLSCKKKYLHYDLSSEEKLCETEGSTVSTVEHDKSISQEESTVTDITENKKEEQYYKNFDDKIISHPEKLSHPTNLTKNDCSTQDKINYIDANAIEPGEETSIAGGQVYSEKDRESLVAPSEVSSSREVNLQDFINIENIANEEVIECEMEKQEQNLPVEALISEEIPLKDFELQNQELEQYQNQSQPISVSYISSTDITKEADDDLNTYVSLVEKFESNDVVKTDQYYKANINILKKSVSVTNLNVIIADTKVRKRKCRSKSTTRIEEINICKESKRCFDQKSFKDTIRINEKIKENSESNTPDFSKPVEHTACINKSTNQVPNESKKVERNEQNKINDTTRLDMSITNVELLDHGKNECELQKEGIQETMTNILASNSGNDKIKLNEKRSGKTKSTVCKKTKKSRGKSKKYLDRPTTCKDEKMGYQSEHIPSHLDLQKPEKTKAYDEIHNQSKRDKRKKYSGNSNSELNNIVSTTSKLISCGMKSNRSEISNENTNSKSRIANLESNSEIVERQTRSSKSKSDIYISDLKSVNKLPKSSSSELKNSQSLDCKIHKTKREHCSKQNNESNINNNDLEKTCQLSCKSDVNKNDSKNHDVDDDISKKKKGKKKTKETVKTDKESIRNRKKKNDLPLKSDAEEEKLDEININNLSSEVKKLQTVELQLLKAKSESEDGITINKIKSEDNTVRIENNTNTSIYDNSQNENLLHSSKSKLIEEETGTLGVTPELLIEMPELEVDQANNEKSNVNHGSSKLSSTENNQQPLDQQHCTVTEETSPTQTHEQQLHSLQPLVIKDAIVINRNIGLYHEFNTGQINSELDHSKESEIVDKETSHVLDMIDEDMMKTSDSKEANENNTFVEQGSESKKASVQDTTVPTVLETKSGVIIEPNENIGNKNKNPSTKKRKKTNKNRNKKYLNTSCSSTISNKLDLDACDEMASIKPPTIFKNGKGDRQSEIIFPSHSDSQDELAADQAKTDKLSNMSYVFNKSSSETNKKPLDQHFTTTEETLQTESYQQPLGLSIIKDANNEKDNILRHEFTMNKINPELELKKDYKVIEKKTSDIMDFIETTHSKESIWKKEIMEEKHELEKARIQDIPVPAVLKNKLGIVRSEPTENRHNKNKKLPSKKHKKSNKSVGKSKKYSDISVSSTISSKSGLENAKEMPNIKPLTVCKDERKDYQPGFVSSSHLDLQKEEIEADQKRNNELSNISCVLNKLSSEIVQQPLDQKHFTITEETLPTESHKQPLSIINNVNGGNENITLVQEFNTNPINPEVEHKAYKFVDDKTSNVMDSIKTSDFKEPIWEHEIMEQECELKKANIQDTVIPTVLENQSGDDIIRPNENRDNENQKPLIKHKKTNKGVGSKYDIDVSSTICSKSDLEESNETTSIKSLTICHDEKEDCQSDFITSSYSDSQKEELEVDQENERLMNISCVSNKSSIEETDQKPLDEQRFTIIQETLPREIHVQSLGPPTINDANRVKDSITLHHEFDTNKINPELEHSKETKVIENRVFNTSDPIETNCYKTTVDTEVKEQEQSSGNNDEVILVNKQIQELHIARSSTEEINLDDIKPINDITNDEENNYIPAENIKCENNVLRDGNIKREDNFLNNSTAESLNLCNSREFQESAVSNIVPPKEDIIDKESVVSENRKDNVKCLESTISINEQADQLLEIPNSNNLNNQNNDCNVNFLASNVTKIKKETRRNYEVDTARDRLQIIQEVFEKFLSTPTERKTIENQLVAFSKLDKRSDKKKEREIPNNLSTHIGGQVRKRKSGLANDSLIGEKVLLNVPLKKTKTDEINISVSSCETSKQATSSLSISPKKKERKSIESIVNHLVEEKASKSVLHGEISKAEIHSSLLDTVDVTLLRKKLFQKMKTVSEQNITSSVDVNLSNSVDPCKIEEVPNMAVYTERDIFKNVVNNEVSVIEDNKVTGISKHIHKNDVDKNIENQDVLLNVVNQLGSISHKGLDIEKNYYEVKPKMELHENKMILVTNHKQNVCEEFNSSLTETIKLDKIQKENLILNSPSQIISETLVTSTSKDSTISEGLISVPVKNNLHVENFADTITPSSTFKDEGLHFKPSENNVMELKAKHCSSLNNDIQTSFVEDSSPHDVTGQQNGMQPLNTCTQNFSSTNMENSNILNLSDLMMNVDADPADVTNMGEITVLPEDVCMLSDIISTTISSADNKLFTFPVTSQANIKDHYIPLNDDTTHKNITTQTTASELTSHADKNCVFSFNEEINSSTTETINSTELELNLQDVPFSKICSSAQTLELISPKSLSVVQSSGSSNFMNEVPEDNESSDIITGITSVEADDHNYTMGSIGGPLLSGRPEEKNILSTSFTKINRECLNKPPDVFPLNDNQLQEFGEFSDTNLREIMPPDDTYKLTLDNEYAIKRVVMLADQTSSDVNVFSLSNYKIADIESMNLIECSILSSEDNSNSKEYLEMPNQDEKSTHIGPWTQFIMNEDPNQKVVVLSNEQCFTPSFSISHNDLDPSFQNQVVEPIISTPILAEQTNWPVNMNLPAETITNDPAHEASTQKKPLNEKEKCLNENVNSSLPKNILSKPTQKNTLKTDFLPKRSYSRTVLRAPPKKKTLTTSNVIKKVTVVKKNIVQNEMSNMSAITALPDIDTSTDTVFIKKESTSSTDSISSKKGSISNNDISNLIASETLNPDCKFISKDSNSVVSDPKPHENILLLVEHDSRKILPTQSPSQILTHCKKSPVPQDRNVNISLSQIPQSFPVIESSKSSELTVQTNMADLVKSRKRTATNKYSSNSVSSISTTKHLPTKAVETAKTKSRITTKSSAESSSGIDPKAKYDVLRCEKEYKKTPNYSRSPKCPTPSKSLAEDDKRKSPYEVSFGVKKSQVEDVFDKSPNSNSYGIQLRSCSANKKHNEFLTEAPNKRKIKTHSIEDILSENSNLNTNNHLYENELKGNIHTENRGVKRGSPCTEEDDREVGRSSKKQGKQCTSDPQSKGQKEDFDKLRERGNVNELIRLKVTKDNKIKMETRYSPVTRCDSTTEIKEQNHPRTSSHLPDERSRLDGRGDERRPREDLDLLSDETREDLDLLSGSRSCNSNNSPYDLNKQRTREGFHLNSSNRGRMGYSDHYREKEHQVAYSRRPQSDYVRDRHSSNQISSSRTPGSSPMNVPRSSNVSASYYSNFSAHSTHTDRQPQVAQGHPNTTARNSNPYMKTNTKMSEEKQNVLLKRLGDKLLIGRKDSKNSDEEYLWMEKMKQQYEIDDLTPPNAPQFFPEKSGTHSDHK